MTADIRLDTLPNIILGVPGSWKDRAHFLESVVKSSDFIFAADVLYHAPSKRALTVELYGPDPRLQRAFTIASGGRISAADLEAIGCHTMTAYIIGPGGNYENAAFVAQAGGALLKAGGLAIKVETSGLAHSRERWLQLADEEMLIYGLEAFVLFIEAKDSLYSCGMHNLGFRDAIFHYPPPDALDQIRLFLRYTLHPEKPLSDNNTVTLGSIKYRLHTAPCSTFPPDSHFHNPYGLWSIESL